MTPAGSRGRRANAPAAHPADAAARAMRTRVAEIRRHQRRGRFSAIYARKKQRGGAFQHRPRRVAQKIREPHINGLFAPSDGQNQAAVRIELHAKPWRTAVTTEPREHTLEERPPSGNERNFSPRRSHHWSFRRRTGGGATSCVAFSASVMTSRVPSIASSRLSL